MREEVSAWGDMGTNVGRALVGAAKEVGVAANEFANTNLGKVVTLIIVFKLIGATLIKLLVGGVIMAVSIGLGVWLIRTDRWHDTKYEYRPMLFGLWRKKEVTEINWNRNAAENQLIIGSIVLAVGIIISLIVIF